MDNIRNLSCHQFRYHVLSDGVSAVLHFDKPEPPLSESIAADIIKQKIDSDKLDYEIGIDPGMRTYMAVVRRDVRTGAEVSSSKSHITVNSRIEIFSNEWKILDLIYSFSSFDYAIKRFYCISFVYNSIWLFPFAYVWVDCSVYSD